MIDWRPSIYRYSNIRWYPGDMTELFKIIKGICDPTCVSHFDFMEISNDLIRTIGNNFKLVQHQCHCNLRKFNFINCAISTWNSVYRHLEDNHFPGQTFSGQFVRVLLNNFSTTGWRMSGLRSMLLENVARRCFCCSSTAGHWWVTMNCEVKRGAYNYLLLLGLPVLTNNNMINY